MTLLPSGLHCCIDCQPLDDLIEKVNNGSGLHIPDLLVIHETDDLRRHMRLQWLLPLGSDCAIDVPLHSLSEQVPAGLTWVDSGHCMNRLPDHLDERDRHALSLFWESPDCQSFLEQQMEKVRPVQRLLITFRTPEDFYLHEWFPAPPPRPLGATPSIR